MFQSHPGLRGPGVLRPQRCLQAAPLRGPGPPQVASSVPAGCRVQRAGQGTGRGLVEGHRPSRAKPQQGGRSPGSQEDSFPFPGLPPPAPADALCLCGFISQWPPRSEGRAERPGEGRGCPLASRRDVLSLTARWPSWATLLPDPGISSMQVRNVIEPRAASSCGGTTGTPRPAGSAICAETRDPPGTEPQPIPL